MTTQRGALMSRMALLSLVGVLLWSIAACGGSSGDGASAPAGTAAEIIDEVFAGAGVQPFGETVPITTDEEMQFYLGSTSYPPFTDAAVNLPMVSIDARAMYVLESATAEDAIKVVEQLKVDVDPERLICVTFAPGDVVTERRDTVVFMVIDSDATERTALVDAFRALP